jgi:hypothetical protein
MTADVFGVETTCCVIWSREVGAEQVAEFGTSSVLHAVASAFLRASPYYSIVGYASAGFGLFSL